MKKRMLLWSFVTAIPMLVAIFDSRWRRIPAVQRTQSLLMGTKPLKIVPIVVLKPGETTKLLLSTHCKVGGTRGGGFEFAAMKDGKAQKGPTTGHAGRVLQRERH